MNKPMLLAPMLCILIAAPPLHAGTYLSGPFSQCFDGSVCPGAAEMARAQERGGPTRATQKPAPVPNGLELPGGVLTLQGQLDGTWEQVSGYVVFTYDFTPTRPDIGRLQLLVRGWPALPGPGTNGYQVQWDRSSYWLDFDGDGSEVPHLLPTQQLFSAYVPQTANDPYPEFATDENVLEECTTLSPCTIQLSEYVQLREPGVDYSQYEDEAASVDLLFVANRFGQAIAAVVDVYDANQEFVETKDLVEDDQLKLSVIAYKVSEPDSLYVIGYTEFAPLEPALRIELQNYIPGADFEDSWLAADLNAGQRRMKLLLEGYRGDGANGLWAFGGPYDLGFTWAEALIFLNQDGFETPAAAPNSTLKQLVRVAN